MPTKAKILIAVTIASGCMVLLASLAATSYSFPEPLRFLHCLVLAVLASTFKIKLPRVQHAIAANFVLFLIALAELPLQQTLIIAVSCCVFQCLWRPRTRPKMIRVLFSAATTATSIYAAYAASASLRDSGAVVLEVVIASIVFFVANSGLVSTVVAFVQGESIADVWRNCHRWAFPYYLVGSGIAAWIATYSRIYGSAKAFAMLPLMYMLYACYQEWIKVQNAETDLA